MMQDSCSILVIEDEMITATSIVELLKDEDYEVMGIARDAQKALLMCNQAETPPSIIICDINIIGAIKGVELAAQLKELYQCEIIFLTAYSDQKTLGGAFELEPVMYVVKPFTDAQLLVALQLGFHKMLKKSTFSSTSTLLLTEREKEIAHLVAHGLSSKQIGRKLNISIETVKTHRRRMLSKNSIKNFPQLVFLMQQTAL